MKLTLNRRKLVPCESTTRRFPVRVMDWRRQDRDRGVLRKLGTRNIQILLNGRVQPLLFYADLNRGIVGTYDTRGDGEPHASNDEVETAFLAGKIEIVDVQGGRWI